jgi:hypothetical protein
MQPRRAALGGSIVAIVATLTMGATTCDPPTTSDSGGSTSDQAPKEVYVGAGDDWFEVVPYINEKHDTAGSYQCTDSWRTVVYRFHNKGDKPHKLGIGMQALGAAPLPPKKIELQPDQTVKVELPLWIEVPDPFPVGEGDKNSGYGQHQMVSLTWFDITTLPAHIIGKRNSSDPWTQADYVCPNPAGGKGWADAR